MTPPADWYEAIEPMPAERLRFGRDESPLPRAVFEAQDAAADLHFARVSRHPGWTRREFRACLAPPRPNPIPTLAPYVNPEMAKLLRGGK